VERPTFAGLKVSQDDVGNGVQHIESRDRPGLSFDPMYIHQGCNSTFQALNLVMLMGASRVVLLGCDMGASPEGRVHWHGDHPKGLNNPQQRNFDNWVAAFAGAVEDLADADVEVINCTPTSALHCFPKHQLEGIL